MRARTPGSSARLTGVRVDIRSETQLAEGIPSGGRDADVEYADGEWIANAETGEMEWHAADGSVISEAEWQAQAETPADEIRPTRCRRPTRRATQSGSDEPRTDETEDAAETRRRRGRRSRGEAVEEIELDAETEAATDEPAATDGSTAEDVNDKDDDA